MYWKQEISERDWRLEAIVNQQGDAQEFDAANFLYELYRTSTVREIDSFKTKLTDVQSGIIQSEFEKHVTGKEHLTGKDADKIKFFEKQDDLINMSEAILGASEQLSAKADSVEKLDHWISKIELEIVSAIEG